MHPKSHRSGVLMIMQAEEQHGLRVALRFVK
jgi:hypothetical protein